MSTMNTIVTESPEEAAEFIRSGRVAAFPTETVYGLGADVFHPEAVDQIFEAKGRPADNPLIVHVSSNAQVELVSADIRPYAVTLMQHFFPGPLTLVLEKAARIPPRVTAGLDTVGVRMPRHQVALAFLRACETVVAAPSANRSGRPSPTSWQAVLEDLDGRIPCLLKGGRSDMGLESTVVDCTGHVPIVLRRGAVTCEELRTVIHDLQTLDEADNRSARSPGLRHRHYAPRGKVMMVKNPPTDPPRHSGYIGLAAPRDEGAFVLHRVCRDLRAYAYELFDFFRACDASGIQTIYCQLPPDTGLGAAIADRLRRASESHG